MHACLCIFSNLWELSSVQLSKITDPYSRTGLTKVLYMCILVYGVIFCGILFMMVRRFPASEHILLMWVSQVILSLKVNPRCLCVFTCSNCRFCKYKGPNACLSVFLEKIIYFVLVGLNWTSHWLAHVESVCRSWLILFVDKWMSVIVSSRQVSSAKSSMSLSILSSMSLVLIRKRRGLKMDASLDMCPIRLFSFHDNSLVSVLKIISNPV